MTWVMSQGRGLVALGVPRASKKKFFFGKPGHVAYQNDGDVTKCKNRMQVKFSP